MDQVDLLLVELQADVAKENAMNLDMMSNSLTMKDQVSSKRVDKGGLRDLKPMGAYRRTEERFIPKEVRTCYVCKDDIEEGGIKFKNEYYHDHHFTCSVCQIIMRNLKVFHVENNLLCENDYHKKYSNWCEYCKDIIKGDGIEACNKHFCSDHFFCSQCGTDLSNVQYFEYKGKAFCANDYGNFAERCTHCNLPLLDSYVTCADKLYHSKCLVCSTKGCGQILNTNSLYVDDGKPYCELHFYTKMDGVCVYCNEIILGRCIIFQEKRYHPLHFCCSFCRTNLDTRGYKAKADKPYCGDCFIKLFN